MRTIARETAFKIIFASQFSGEVDKELCASLIKADKLNDDDKKYLKRVLEIYSEKREEYLKLIDGYSVAFPESAIYTADRSILLLALCEIKCFDDIPEKVTANEAANLASKYSSERSASFVSGILSEIIKE